MTKVICSSFTLRSLSIRNSASPKIARTFGLNQREKVCVMLGVLSAESKVQPAKAASRSAMRWTRGVSRAYSRGWIR